MISPEQYIADLERTISKLEEELIQAKKHFEDFEVLAIEWKCGYNKLNAKHSIAIQEKDQIIKELQDELEFSKSYDFNDRVKNKPKV